MILPLLVPLSLLLRFATSVTPAVHATVDLQAAERHWMIERSSSERWMHARQRPEFTVPVAAHAWWQVSVNDEPQGGRVVSVVFPNRTIGVTRVHVDSLGRLQSTETTPAPIDPRASALSRALWQTPRDSMRRADQALFEGINSGLLSLPAMRASEIIPVFAPRLARKGAAWRDTIAVEAAQNGHRQRLTGIRISTIMGDTTVADRRLWIVRQQGTVQYAERWLEYERTLDSAAVVERLATGTVRGRYLYDDSLRLVRASWDTTELAGNASLTYADGRTFPTTARYERTRELTLFDSAGFQAREQARRAAQTPFSIIQRPNGPLEERLAAGDSALGDSLIGVWGATRNARTRDSLFRIVSTWGTRQNSRDRLMQVALKAGDTTRYLRDKENAVWASKLDVPTLQFLLPFMSDPGLPFAFGRNRDVLYENVGGGMMNRPPALIADTASWPCVPAACRLLADQWSTAREPRLRDVALMAHFALDPLRWKDSMEAHAVHGGVAASALNLIRGIGATWPAASRQPIPATDAPWPVWLEWMSGTNPQYPAPTMRGSGSAAFATRVRFESTHRNAITMQQLLTSRDIVRELQRGYAAGNDTARLVFGAMLQGLDKLTLDPANISRALLSPQASLDRALATRALSAAFKSATRADTAVTATITDTLLAMLIDGAAPWKQAGEVAAMRPTIRRLVNGTTPVVVRSETLPEAVKAHWSGRVRLVNDPRWRVTKDQYPIMVLNVSPVEVAGPLARVTVNWTRESTSAEAGGFTAYLLRTETGWVIAGVSEWIA